VRVSTPADKKPEVFVRKASGLIRTAGTWDVLAYNINFTSIGLLLLFLFLFGPAFYPGASLPWATVICVLAILPLALVYGYLASAMPRSGGDYVYVSRVLGPALGMMSNWNMTMWWFFYGGVPSAFLARYGLAPFFRTMGIYTGNSTLTSIGNWFTTKAGTFILGTCLIVLLIVVFSMGTKTYFKIQNILILFAVASTVLTVAVFIGKVPADTIHAFNVHLREVSGKAIPSAYVAQSAKEAGYAGLAPFSLFWTLMVMTWIYLNLSFMSSSAYIGSEVKNARKLQLWSMPATLFIVGIGVLISVWVIDHAVGYDFLAQLGWADPTGLGLDSTPVFQELASFVSNNIVLAFLICFGFIFWSYAWLPGQILNGSRNIFAYSLDGLLPSWFKKVNQKRFTPVNSLLTMGIASIIALGIYVFTDLFSTLVGIFGFILSFIVISISAALLPYRLPDVFETSAVNQRLGRVPVITIIGVFSVAAQVFMAWVFLRDPSAGLNGNPKMIWFNVIVFLSGLVVYYVAKFVQRSRGVDVDLSFKQVPEE
jgi:basic amino acid/polyamine antiporter, APA family